VKSVLPVVAVLCVFVLVPGPARAMFEQGWTSVRADGMGGAFVAVADDPGALAMNPAGLYRLAGPAMAGSYKLLFGGLGVNLHSASAGFCIPAGRAGVMGIALRETGFELHSERTVRFGHGLKLAEGIGVGYGLAGYNLYQKGVGSGYGFGLDVGMFAQVYRVWTLGFSARNLNLPRIGTGPEGDLPRALAFGIGYSPKPYIHSALDLEKEPGKGTRVRVGQELRIVQDHLTLRAGISTLPVCMAFGLRAGIKSVGLDYALKTHPELGLTHDFGIAVEF